MVFALEKINSTKQKKKVFCWNTNYKTSEAEKVHYTDILRRHVRDLDI